MLKKRPGVYLVRPRVVFDVEEKTYGIFGKTECRVPGRRKYLKSACDRRTE